VLIAAGFAVGALAHATGLVLLLVGERLYGPHYPWWRHAAMVAADVAVAAIAVRRPRWLLAALGAFLLEQIVVNGVSLTAVAVMIAAGVHVFFSSGTSQED
jgi:hypothetical protein